MREEVEMCDKSVFIFLSISLALVQSCLTSLSDFTCVPLSTNQRVTLQAWGGFKRDSLGKLFPPMNKKKI